MLVRIALIVTQMANGRVNHPTNWVNDSAPNLPNKREIGPPPAAIIRNDNTAKPPKTNTNTKDRIDLSMPPMPLNTAAPIACGNNAGKASRPNQPNHIPISKSRSISSSGRQSWKYFG